MDERAMFELEMLSNGGHTFNPQGTARRSDTEKATQACNMVRVEALSTNCTLASDHLALYQYHSATRTCAVERQRISRPMS